ncbi:MAG: SMP-30/gluconolactonase/LRE family protein, partial [Candidatus Hydrogenedentes bacterium]|nr:SMP-30/gluconolactonase/LRE family protein [Candidatus Hydrogenedentota bacterium]
MLLLAALAPMAAGQPTYRFERLWPTLQQPWYFYRPSGVAAEMLGAGAAIYRVSERPGSVFIADTSNNRIRKFSAEGQYVTEWGREGAGPGEFDWPTGLAIGPGRLLYVADRNNGRIQVFDQDGNFQRQWPTMIAKQGALFYPTGVAVDRNSFVYVTDGGNPRVHKYTATGELADFYVGDGSSAPGIEPCVPDLIPCGWAPGITVDARGKVYASDPIHYRVVRFNANLDVERFIGEFGEGDGQFNTPFGLAVDAESNLYVCDVFNDRIQKFNRIGQFVLAWGAEGLEPGHFGSPTAVSVDGVGNVYVVETNTDRVQKFTTDGVFQAEIGSSSGRRGAFNNPLDVATGPDGSVYVADTLNNRIQKFSAEGQFVRQWGTVGRVLPGRFVGPEGLTVDSAGNVYVADTYSMDSGGAPPRIQIFDADGEFLVERVLPNVSGTPDVRDEFVFPRDIAVDSVGNVYVSQDSYDREDASSFPPTRHRIQKFAPDGRLLRAWGGFGDGPGEFNSPTSLAFDADDNLYVADTSNYRIQKFDSQGAFLGAWGEFGAHPGQFDEPRGVAVAPDGTIVVSDFRNNRLQRFTNQGALIEVLGSPGDSPGQLLLPAGIDFGAGGSFYLADSRHSRLQQYVPLVLSEVNKAIIVAGGGPFRGNPLWPATQMLCNVAYHALRYQGYDKPAIRYLSSDTQFDVDNDGVADDVLPATPAMLEESIVDWASNAAGLILYLTGPGEQDSFRMSADDSLVAVTLDGWLDTLQAGLPGRVNILYDASSAGSFLDDLLPPNGRQRVVVASTSADQPAYFASHGTLSFSNAFWVSVFNGDDFPNAFFAARAAVAEQVDYQTPLIDVNGNGIGNDPGDVQIIAGVAFNGIRNFDRRPNIESVSPPLVLQPEESSAALFADGVRDDLGAINRCWAVIRPPGGNILSFDKLVLDLPTVELRPIAGDKGTNTEYFEGTYDDFDRPGAYKVDVYALDGNLNVAEVSSTTVTKSGILAGALYCLVYHLADTQRLPILNATVMLDPGSQSNTEGEQGLYAFPVLADGSYTVEVTAPGYFGASQDFDIVGAEVVTLAMPLTQVP